MVWGMIAWVYESGEYEGYDLSNKQVLQFAGALLGLDGRDRFSLRSGSLYQTLLSINLCLGENNADS